MSQASTQPPNTRTDVVCTSTTAFAELQQSLSVYTDPTERQRVVLQRSVHVLQQLLQQWTTVDLSAPTGASQEQQAQSANQQQPTATAFSGEDWTETMKNSASRSSLPNRSKPAKPADDALPPGWTKHRDPATGRFYYYDTNTLKTQSEVPSATISDVPAFKRRSTPYASTTKERTFVGERSQSSIPQSTTESAGFNAEDFLARVFDRYGASKSNNFGTKVRDPNTCWACNGHGGRKDKIKTCQRCNGSGLLTEMRQRGSLMQRFQPVCPQCNGEGDMIREKYRCKVCNGTKKHPRNSSYEPEPKPHQETFHEEGTPRQFQAPPSGQQANKGGDEDEPGTEVQCASQ